MNANKPASTNTWVDHDDAPEWTGADFDQARWKIGARDVSAEEGKTAFKVALRRGRPPAAQVKQTLTVRYDAEIIAAFRSTGRGWQTRMNDALRDWLKAHPLR